VTPEAAGPFGITGSQPAITGARAGQARAGATRSAYVVAAGPRPVLTSIAPAAALQNVPPFTLHAYGSLFDAGAVILWNGSAVTTTVISSGELRATVSVAGLAAGVIPVVVRNGTGIRSGTLSFTLQASAIPAIVIDGELTGSGASRRVLVASLTIHDQLNEVPNTCTFTVQGARPVEGADLLIAYGSANGSTRLFAGVILRVTQIYAAQRPANVLYQVEGIDHNWELNRRIVVAQYTNQSATDIAADLVATWAPAGAGFTTAIEAGLPVLDTISFTNTPLMDALTQLATRIGGYANCSYYKVIGLWLTPRGTPPTQLTPSHPTLQEFQVTRDLSQIVTRALVEGGGVNALALVPPGETRLPVEDPAWYAPAPGGVVASGPQRITYADIVAGGTGAFVGPGVSPSSALTAAIAAGGTLPLGIYKYAYTWVTAAGGETTPAPLAAATVAASGVLANPSVGPTAATETTIEGNLVPNGNYKIKFSWSTASAWPPTQQTLCSPASATANAGALKAVRYWIPAAPAGATQLNVYRTTNGGSTFYAEHRKSTVTPGEVVSNVVGSIDDATLVAQNLREPGSNTSVVPSGRSVALSGIATGPTGTSSRKVYRTAVNGSQLKLLQTIADNTATAIATPDTAADASLGANAPTADTSGLNPTSGIVLAGATAIPVSSVGPFGATGWAEVAGQVIRYTGAAAGALTGIPATGPGAITASINYGREILVAPQLIGIPPAGAGMIRYLIHAGDPVNVLVILDDLGAQASLAAILGGDGVVEEYQQDNRIGIPEATARAQALLELKGPILETYRYRCRDPLTASGKTITVNLPAPTNVAGTFEIQDVTIAGFLGTEELPFYDVVASSRRFTFEDLLRRRRAATMGQG